MFMIELVVDGKIYDLNCILMVVVFIRVKVVFRLFIVVIIYF